MNKISKAAVGAIAVAAATLGVLSTTSASAAVPTPQAGTITALPDAPRLVGFPGQQLSANRAATLQVAGQAGVPDDATAVMVDVTSVSPSAAGSLTLWTTDAGQPGTPTITFGRAGTSTAVAFVGLNDTGKINVVASVNTAFVLAVKGYTEPAAAPAPGPATASATTTVIKWPETSGWAVDDFTRIATITRQGEVEASKCGASATQCWFYVGTLQDNGTFTTVDGHPSPADPNVNIQGANIGDMTGAARVEFYASSDTPIANGPPLAVAGALKGTDQGKITTTNWVELFFPNDRNVQFGQPKLVTYSFMYTLPGFCQSWTDGINPGDDGASVAKDGNITGVSQCTGS